MTRDRIYGYFIEKDNNCAETMLRALMTNINWEYRTTR